MVDYEPGKDDSLLDSASYGQPDLECNLILKGGIASGIVYPWAICELARRYRLRNLAGTSAGAIAAALAAAAEYGRRTSGGGFARLAAIPTWLGDRVRGRGNLLQLFQPAPAIRPLFELLLVAFSGARTTKRLGRLVTLLPRLGTGVWLGLAPGALFVGALVLAAPGTGLVPLGLAALLWLLAATLGIAVTLVFGLVGRAAAAAGAATVALVLASGPFLAHRAGLSPSLLTETWAQEVALFAVALGVIGGCALGLWHSLSRAVPANGFGVCSGNAETGAGGAPALTPWLNDRIQELAGRTAADPPLTFADLQGRAGEPPIRLRALTTCLTLGRPYLLPLETKIFYFDPRELRRLFPSTVVEFMERAATAWSRGEDPENRPDDNSCRVNRWMLPRLPLPRAKLPIVVAARLSLSFPLLLSAVPLWHIDWRRHSNKMASRAWRHWREQHPEVWRAIRMRPDLQAPQAPREVPEAERCWFSDGGICSNFPVHLFDRPLPRRPTVAINLKHDHTTAPDDHRVQLVSHLRQPWLLEAWERIENGPAGGQLTRFLGVILDSMQNWADNSLLRVAGYRDRIAHIHLEPGEGGLNLDMDADHIQRLAGWGREAGAALAERFARAPETGMVPSWDNHRWARFRTTLAQLQTSIEHLMKDYDTIRGPSGLSYRQLIERGRDAHPQCLRLQDDQRDQALATLEQLEVLVQSWRATNADFRRGAPRPEPKLQIQAPLSC